MPTPLPFQEPTPDPSQTTGLLEPGMAAQAAPLVPTVALGGSAGSLAALQSFLRAAEPDAGVAYVVVTHLAPDQQSNLAQVLQHATEMPVQQVQDTTTIAPNRVYVIPPGQSLQSIDGTLTLEPLARSPGQRLTVDTFFRTLAETHHQQAIAVVLSGMDGDGAIGIQRIKEFGGLTIAQDPSEAAYPDMPRSAMATGSVDWVLRSADMPAMIASYARRASRMRLPADEQPASLPDRVATARSEEEALRDVLAFLRLRVGRDFSYYKRATVLRRIGRRMRVNGLDDMQGYLGYLQVHPEEAHALLQDLLISVTNFFRDPEAFAALALRVPALFADKGPEGVVRVWVAGCATGEEAYSVAILLHEHARTLESPPAIQVFATDLDEFAVQVARRGLYPHTIGTDVSSERLRRFFTREEHGYCVRREVRESVLFALHDLLGDSPFSRLDMVACRNLLIYLNRSAQGRALELFHFALRPAGLLLLGTSETLDEADPLFGTLDKRQHLYTPRGLPRTSPQAASSVLSARTLPFQRRPGGLPHAAPSWLRERLPTPRAGQPPPREPPLGDAEAQRTSWSDIHYRLLEKLGPPSLLVDARQEIVHVSETAGRFLQFTGGEPSRNVFQAIHPALRIELRAALYRALQSGEGSVVAPVPLGTGPQAPRVGLRVVPDTGHAADFALVIFEVLADDNEAARFAADASPPAAPEPAALRLEAELDTTKAQLREVIERAEGSTEELKASNEELQAMNEELRSATEELETGREELLSLNEELSLVNAELKNSVEQLGQANSDLHNLMASTSIATIFLDRELRIKRYTPSAVDLFSLIPGDLGRPLDDLKTGLDYGAIRQDAARALQLLQPCERELSANGRWFIARAAPYRTSDDHIAGVVLTFIEITGRKHAEESLRASSEQLRLIIESAREYAIFSTDLGRRVTTWNSGAQRLLGYEAEQIIGQPLDIIFTPEDRAGNAPDNEATVALRTGRAADERWHLRSDGTRFWASGVMMPLRDVDGTAIGLIKIFRDQTDMRMVMEALEQSRIDVEAASRAKDQFLAVLSHELRAPLSPISLVIDALALRPDMPGDIGGMLDMMRRNVRAQTRLIDDLLDITRISHGKVEIARAAVDMHAVIRSAAEVCQPQVLARGQQLLLVLDAGEPGVLGDFDRLRQCIANVLQNASKFSADGRPITLRTHNDAPGWLSVEVTDRGIGIAQAALDGIFAAFAQGDERITREYGGLGLGLAITKALVTAHGGSVAAQSHGENAGSTISIRLPLMKTGAATDPGALP